MQPFQRLKQESNLKQARRHPPPSLLLAMNFNQQIEQLSTHLNAKKAPNRPKIFPSARQ
jgi:hypothetical protein